MLSCLFCKRKKTLFKICVIYDGTECPIKDYITEFFGAVNSYLNEDQGICETCVVFLDNLIYARNFMYEALTSEPNEAYIHLQNAMFTHMYSKFRRNLRKVDYGKSESRQSSPGVHSVGCSMPDIQHNELELQRVQKYTYDSRKEDPRGGTPSADREVQDAFIRTNSRASFYSEPWRRRARSNGTSRNLSYFSDSDLSDNERVQSRLRYDKKGRLLNKKTRSISRIQDEINAKLAECLHMCVDGCREEFDDLKQLTTHKINDHKMLAKYWCYECFDAKFTSQEDLDKHNGMYHRILISNCLLCSEEVQTQDELQKHLQEHKLHSVPCNYCDKYFLTGSSCESHIRECHKGRRKRIKALRPQTILDRIDKEVCKKINCNEEHKSPNKNYDVRILIQPNRGSSAASMNSTEYFRENSLCSDFDESFDNQRELLKPPSEVSTHGSSIRNEITSEENRSLEYVNMSEERSTIEDGSIGQIGEEICVTAMEETFIADIEEIPSNETEDACTGEEEELCSTCSSDKNYSFEITCHNRETYSDENIHSDKDHSSPKTVAGKEFLEREVFDSQSVHSDNFGEVNEISYIDDMLDMYHEEVIIDGTEHQPSSSTVVKDLEIEDKINTVSKLTAETNVEANEVILNNTDGDDEEIEHVHKTPPINDLISLQSFTTKKDDFEKFETNQQKNLQGLHMRTLKIVLEKLKLGRGVKTVISKQDKIVEVQKFKTADTFTKKGRVSNNKKMSSTSSLHPEDSARNKPGIYDFIDEDDVSKTKQKKFDKYPAKSKVGGTTKLQQKNFKSNAPYKFKSKPSTSKDQSKSAPKDVTTESPKISAKNSQSSKISNRTSGSATFLERELELELEKSRKSIPVRRKNKKAVDGNSGLKATKSKAKLELQTENVV